jgi:tetratricopeptide (TPR) repeat protein
MRRAPFGSQFADLRELPHPTTLRESTPMKTFHCVRIALAAGALSATPIQSSAQGNQPRTPQADSIRTASRLDTDGKHAEARAIFQRLIDGAATPAARAAAQRRMAVSYAFEGNCEQAVRYEELVVDYWKTREQAEPQNAFYQQGEMANEAARLCIDIGALDVAERMYRRGSELGLKEPEPKTHPKSLWDFRLAHALARLAARRGNAVEAARQVATARRILDADTAMASAQARFYPYLVGYVALFSNDLRTAEAELTKAIAMQGNATDPFLHVLLGMTYEKQGDATRTTAMYQKAHELATGHNPPAAYSRPFARKKLGL